MQAFNVWHGIEFKGQVDADRSEQALGFAAEKFGWHIDLKVSAAATLRELNLMARGSAPVENCNTKTFDVWANGKHAGMIYASDAEDALEFVYKSLPGAIRGRVAVTPVGLPSLKDWPRNEAIDVARRESKRCTFCNVETKTPCETALTGPCWTKSDTMLSLLREVAALKRYDNKSGWTGNKVGVVSTLSIPDDLLERIDAMIKDTK